MSIAWWHRFPAPTGPCSRGRVRDVATAGDVPGRRTAASHGRRAGVPAEDGYSPWACARAILSARSCASWPLTGSSRVPCRRAYSRPLAPRQTSQPGNRPASARMPGSSGWCPVMARPARCRPAHQAYERRYTRYARRPARVTGPRRRDHRDGGRPLRTIAPVPGQPGDGSQAMSACPATGHTPNAPNGGVI
jgi:hypothetical protein